MEGMEGMEGKEWRLRICTNGERPIIVLHETTSNFECT